MSSLIQIGAPSDNSRQIEDFGTPWLITALCSRRTAPEAKEDKIAKDPRKSEEEGQRKSTRWIKQSPFIDEIVGELAISMFSIHHSATLKRNGIVIGPSGSLPEGFIPQAIKAKQCNTAEVTIWDRHDCAMKKNKQENVNMWNCWYFYGNSLEPSVSWYFKKELRLILKRMMAKRQINVHVCFDSIQKTEKEILGSWVLSIMHQLQYFLGSWPSLACLFVFFACLKHAFRFISSDFGFYRSVEITSFELLSDFPTVLAFSEKFLWFNFGIFPNLWSAAFPISYAAVTEVSMVMGAIRLHFPFPWYTWQLLKHRASRLGTVTYCNPKIEVQKAFTQTKDQRWHTSLALQLLISDIL